MQSIVELFDKEIRPIIILYCHYTQISEKRVLKSGIILAEGHEAWLMSKLSKLYVVQFDIFFSTSQNILAVTT